MRILLMGQHFWPEDIAGAIHATQLATDLTAKGHQVTFATGFPNYPFGRVFDGYGGKLLRREKYREVTIIRTWSHLAPKEAIKRRFITYATFSFTAFISGLIARSPDIVMSYSPPMPLGLAALLVSKLRGIPWILRIEDLFPEYAIKAGIIQNRTAIRILEWFERLFYKHATHISVISDGFRQKLLDRGIPSEKLSVIPVWADPDEVKPMSRETAFRIENGWQGKFIILYTGNLGMTSMLEDAIDAAEILQNHSNIHFVIVGEGVKKSNLMSRATAKRLINISFLPYQSRQRFPELLATADVTLVSLNKDSYETSLPSKTFNYFAAERATIIVAPLESDLSKIVGEAGAGFCVPPDNAEELSNLILRLQADPQLLISSGKNARILLEKKFSRTRCVHMYEEMLARFGLEADVHS